MIERIKNKTGHIVPLIWLAIGYVWDIWYHLVRGRAMLDSDMSHELLLADLLNKEHSIIGMSKNWLYDSELRFLGMQWMYRLGLLVFPHNWHLARTASMALALALLALAVWLSFQAVGKGSWGLWAAALTVFPGGGWYFWQTIYGGFFITYILISLFSFYLIMRYINESNRKKRILFVSLIIIIALGSGINGVKQLMVFYAPLCLTAIVALVIRIRKNGTDMWRNGKIFTDRSFVFLMLSVVSTVSSVVGYMINSIYLVNIYHFECFNATPIEYQDFLMCLRWYIWSFGFAEGKILMSPAGIASMTGVVFGILVVVSGIRIVMRVSELPDGLMELSMLSVVSIGFCCFLFAYVSSHGAIQYYQPVVPLGLFLLVIEVFSDPLIIPEGATVAVSAKYRFIILNVLAVALVFISMGTIHNENNEPFHKYRARPTLGNVVGIILEHGYTQGISTFWTADVAAELSDGRLEMWSISTESPDEWNDRGQKADHLVAGPKGRYFYIFDLTRGEEDAHIDIGLAYIEKHQEAGVPMPIYFDEDFIIYGN